MRENEFRARLRAGAAELGASVNPSEPELIRRRGDRRRHRTMITSGVLAFAVGAGGGGVAYASLAQPGQPASPASGHSATAGPPTASPASAPPSDSAPSIVGVTTGGAIQVFSSVTGLARTTLVQKTDAIGDAIAVSPSGATVYFAVKRGCADSIESVPVSGGTPAVVTSGVLPAVSPDGTRLAFVREPSGGGPSAVQYGCPGSGDATAKPSALYHVVVRDLATGQETVYPAPPDEIAGMPYAISHLSWAPSGQTLLVSVGPGQGNGGWGLSVLDTATSRYYVPPGWPAASAAAVPVTGSPDAARSYYREGVFTPDGGMFVNRMCCDGVPVRVTSSKLLKINSAGQQIRQVAIGFTDRDHSSLDAYGGWLLYLSAHDLFIAGPGPARKITTGLIAAAWVP